jgi:hypothetical protein
MEIRYLKSLNPIEFVEKPSKETLEFIAKFIQNPHYKEFIEKIRKQSGFPETGIDLLPFVGKNFDNLPLEQSILFRDSLYLLADNLRAKMNLPKSFLQQVYLVVFFNSIVDVSFYEGFVSDRVDFAVTKKQISTRLFDFEHEVGAIFIPYNLSFNIFEKQAKEIWEKLQKEMDENLTDNPYELRLHKNTELAMEITDLKDNQDMSFPEITDKIYNDSDGKDEKLAKEEYIKKLYYEYKALWETSLKQQKPK